MPLRKQEKRSDKNRTSGARQSRSAKKKAAAKKAAKKSSLTAPIAKRTNPPKKKSSAKVIRKSLGVRRKLSDEIASSTAFKPMSPLKFKKSVRRPETISTDQWNLPIGMKANGQYTYLKDLGGPRNKTRLSMATLTGEDKKNLILKRIKDNPNYPTRQMLGIGEVDKARALEEVEAETPAGKFIAESEQRVIQKMIDKLKEQENG